MIHARTDYNRIQDPAGLIGADEPVFLIRAKDKTAASAVRAWAALASKAGAATNIIEAALAHAETIEAWQAKNATQVPDMPTSAERARP